jgi:hypothetical protein
METLMILTAVLSGVNSFLLVFLLVIYGKTFFKSKAVHAIGLMLFALLLLAQNLLAIYAYVDMNMYFGSGALPYLFGIAILELASLIAMVAVTL